MVTQSTELRFARGQVGAKPLQEEVERILSEAKIQTSEASTTAAEADIPISDLETFTISIAEEGQGVEPITTILIVIATALGKDAALKIWNKLVWPRIERKYGVKALGPEKSQ